MLDAILGVFRSDPVAKVFLVRSRPRNRPAEILVAFYREGEKSPVFVGRLDLEMAQWLRDRLQDQIDVLLS